ncbi:hypothetical protein B0H14DRAFT_2565425 [Mycena olivaceomarginata]|nr:hypothetical protein B0H14DRAFT_2565425 [Mycena olivaceomarginata]
MATSTAYKFRTPSNANTLDTVEDRMCWGTHMIVFSRRVFKLSRKSGHLAENAPDWDVGVWMGTAGVRSGFYRKVVGRSMWNWMAAFAAVDRRYLCLPNNFPIWGCAPLAFTNLVRRSRELSEAISDFGPKRIKEILWTHTYFY